MSNSSDEERPSEHEHGAGEFDAYTPRPEKPTSRPRKHRPHTTHHRSASQAPRRRKRRSKAPSELKRTEGATSPSLAEIFAKSDSETQHMHAHLSSEGNGETSPHSPNTSTVDDFNLSLVTTTTGRPIKSILKRHSSRPLSNTFPPDHEETAVGEEEAAPQDPIAFFTPDYAGDIQEQYNIWGRALNAAINIINPELKNEGDIVENDSTKASLQAVVLAYRNIMAKIQDEMDENFYLEDCNILIAAYNALTLCGQPNHQEHITRFQLLLKNRITSIDEAGNICYEPLPERNEQQRNSLIALGFALLAALAAAASVLAAIFTKGAWLKVEQTITTTVGLGAGGAAACFGFAGLFAYKAKQAYQRPLLPTVKSEGNKCIDELTKPDTQAALSRIRFA